MRADAGGEAYINTGQPGPVSVCWCEFFPSVWLRLGASSLNELCKCFVAASAAVQIGFPNFYENVFKGSHSSLPDAEFVGIRHMFGNDLASGLSGSKENQGMRQIPRHLFVDSPCLVL